MSRGKKVAMKISQKNNSLSLQIFNYLMVNGAFVYMIFVLQLFEVLYTGVTLDNLIMVNVSSKCFVVAVVLKSDKNLDFLSRTKPLEYYFNIKVFLSFFVLRTAQANKVSSFIF